MIFATFLFAEEPTWTNKEVVIAVGSAIATLVPIVAAVLHILTRWYRDRANKAEALAASVKEQHSQETQGGEEKTSLGEIEKQLANAKAEADKLATEYAKAQSDAASQHALAEQLRTDLADVQGNLEKHQQDVGALQRRLDRAFQKDGQIWTERVLANAPEFKPFDPEGRCTPIISVLNLKGGVGKTTITANLGSALDAMGYRVLLLDLDLQGSLSSLFMTDADQEQMFKEEHLLADFFAASFDAEFPNMLDFKYDILDDKKLAIVPTTDGLAYAETNLVLRWLLRSGSRDPRFLLRKELHLMRITREYDIILMDCPPLINMCCVNALAASDYVLVPIMPSIQATARVPILLKRLKQFRENINSELRVMGIVANRTHRSELTADEENRLSLLRVQCKDILGHEVPQFRTFIRQNVEIRVAEDERRPLMAHDEMHNAFMDLAREVEDQFPNFFHAKKRVKNEVLA